MTRSPAIVLGIALDDVTMDETIDIIGSLIARGRAESTTHQVATVNVDFVVNALAQPDVLTILQHADVCLADGMPVVWGARWSGTPLRERVTGVDLVTRLARSSAERGWRVHFFGSAAGIADAAADKLIASFPGARITADAGPLVDAEGGVDDAALEKIASERPDVLCVALGNPKQERFIAANRRRLGVPVLIGVGGSLDMIVGHRRRAPRWMQVSGLEWIFRALQEPARLGRRYARDAYVFLPRLLVQLCTQRMRSGGWILREGDGAVVAVPPDAAGAPFVLAAPLPSPLVIDLAGAPRLASPALASIVGAIRTARCKGGEVTVRNPTPEVAATLRRLGISTR